MRIYFVTPNGLTMASGNNVENSIAYCGKFIINQMYFVLSHDNSFLPGMNKKIVLCHRNFPLTGELTIFKSFTYE